MARGSGGSEQGWTPKTGQKEGTQSAKHTSDETDIVQTDLVIRSQKVSQEDSAYRDPYPLKGCGCQHCFP